MLRTPIQAPSARCQNESFMSDLRAATNRHKGLPPGLPSFYILMNGERPTSTFLPDSEMCFILRKMDTVVNDHKKNNLPWSLSVIEKRKTVSRFFLDLDFKWLPMDNQCYQTQVIKISLKVSQIMNYVLGEYCETPRVRNDSYLVVLCSSEFEEKADFNKRGVHLIFPNLYVDVEQGIMLTKYIISILDLSFPLTGVVLEPHNRWSVVIDTQCFQNGTLRMPFSQKTQRLVFSNKGQKIIQRNWSESYYEPIAVIHCSTNLISLIDTLPMKSMSINYYNPSVSEGIFMPKRAPLRPLGPAHAIGEIQRIPRRETQLHCIDPEGDMIQVSDITLNPVNLKRKNDDPEIWEKKSNMLVMLQKFLFKALKGGKYHGADIASYKYNEEKRFYTVTFQPPEGTFCPNKNAHHTSSTIYLVISLKSVYLRCYSRKDVVYDMRCRDMNKPIYALENDDRELLFPEEKKELITEKLPPNLTSDPEKLKRLNKLYSMIRTK